MKDKKQYLEEMLCMYCLKEDLEEVKHGIVCNSCYIIADYESIESYNIAFRKYRKMIKSFEHG